MHHFDSRFSDFEVAGISPPLDPFNAQRCKLWGHQSGPPDGAMARPLTVVAKQEGDARPTAGRILLRPVFVSITVEIKAGRYVKSPGNSDCFLVGLTAFVFRPPVGLAMKQTVHDF